MVAIKPRRSPAKSRIFEPAPEVKVFCFFSSEKKILLLFRKEARRLYSLCFVLVRVSWFTGA
jgi:hypothetical protein